MNSICAVPVPPRFASVGDVRDGLTTLEGWLIRACDRRGVFVSAYAIATATLEAWLAEDAFLDGGVVKQYLVAFANAYRQALADYETGRRDLVPGAWLQAFDAAREPRLSVFQHLLLGINAHVNHDLPFAVVQGGLDTNCQRCYRDHQRIDDALRVATPAVRQRIATVYRPRLHWANRLYGGPLDRAVSSMFERSRQHSWVLARALQTARTRSDRAGVGALISTRAVRTGCRILRSRLMPATAIASLCPDGFASAEWRVASGE